MAAPLAFFKDSWIPDHDLSIPIDDLGFSLGTTVIERLRTFGGQVYRAEAHLERLRRSLEIVGWDAKGLCTKIARALQEFQQKNAVHFVAGDDWSLVTFVTPGNSPSATDPTVCVHGFPLPFHNWAEQYVSGTQAVIVTTRQVSENCWPPELKCRSRLHYYLADREADSMIRGARGILLDQKGFVGEGTTANVVAYYKHRGLVTPPRTKVLPGVSQQVLYELAAELGIDQVEEDILPAQLAEADEIFFTSTSICMLPVTRLNDQPVGNGQSGQVFQQLINAWSQRVGIDIVEQAQQFAERK
jgi:branched-chain amino acid aminotransferase